MKCAFCGEKVYQDAPGDWHAHGMPCCKFCRATSPETLQIKLLIQIRDKLDYICGHELGVQVPGPRIEDEDEGQRAGL